MMNFVEIVARCAPASRAGKLVTELVGGMVARHGWRHVDDSADRTRCLCLVGADTVVEARDLLGQMPAWLRAHTVLVGPDGEVFQLGRPDPRPGSIGDLLETFGVAGYLPVESIQKWRPILSGFAGRKDLMRYMRTNCLKASQSDRYCDWVHSAGKDAFEFLAALADALIALASSDLSGQP